MSLQRYLQLLAGDPAAADRAQDAIDLALARRAALAILGSGDLVPVARALHRRVLGAGWPFVVADPRRGDVPSVRAPERRATGVEAFAAAQGGTLCARLARLPSDFTVVVGLARAPGVDVRIVIVGDSRYDRHPFLANPPPIRVPSLATRRDELPRIVDEYVLDAIHELHAPLGSFTEEDRRWVIQHASESLGAIETATRRLVALRSSRTIVAAAEKLGMAELALRQWQHRRRRRRGGSGVRSGARTVRRRSAP